MIVVAISGVDFKPSLPSTCDVEAIGLVLLAMCSAIKVGTLRFHTIAQTAEMTCLLRLDESTPVGHHDVRNVGFAGVSVDHNASLCKPTAHEKDTHREK